MDTKNDNVQGLQNEQEKATTETIKPIKAKKQASTKTSTSATKKKASTKKNTSKDETTTKKKTPTKKSATTKSSNSDDVKDTEKKVVKKTTTKKTSKTSSVGSTKERSEKVKEPKQANKKDTSIKEEDNTVKNVEEVVDTVVNDTTTMTSPVVENIKQFKLFFVSDMDEEATYLHEMSLKGQHFESKKGMQYFFKQGEPINYFYHLGYHEKDKHDGSRYLDNYADAGWDNIYHEKAEFDGVWNYFRIEMPEGVSEPNIFSDRSSRLSLYKRLLSAWRSLLALDVICFLCMIFVYTFLTNHPGKLTGTVMTICGILIVIILLIFIIYLRAYLKISKKQSELQSI